MDLAPKLPLFLCFTLTNKERATMYKQSIKGLVGASLLGMLSTGASATLIFQDNFDSEAGGPGVSALNYTSFTNWTVSDGTVDVVANTNVWGISCVGGSGKCIDLDGSTSNAGIFSTNLLVLGAGNYSLSFDISGNQRGGNGDSMLMTLGGFLNESFNLAPSAPWATITRTFTVAADTSNYIVFNHDGGDNIGIMLDNVSLSKIIDVPEPTSLMLLGLGLLGLGFARRRAQK
jgi:hypothetical protein